MDVMATVTTNKKIMNLAKELISFSYILCLLGPLIMALNIKYEIKINIKSRVAEIKKFLIRTPPFKININNYLYFSQKGGFYYINKKF